MNTNVLINLKHLKKDMEKLDWTICSFIFEYKQVKYIVLVKRFVGSDKRIDQYALVKLHFMKEDDLSYELICEANSLKLLLSAKEIREYFGIAYRHNLGDILKQFTESLAACIPSKVTNLECVSEIEKIAMVNSLNKSDCEDPSKIYCKNVMRNCDGKKRSEFNADKTKILRKQLFDYFKDDKTISFCYSNDPCMEKSDEEILKKFAENNK